jgi:hypothetical protein
MVLFNNKNMLFGDKCIEIKTMKFKKIGKGEKDNYCMLLPMWNLDITILLIILIIKAWLQKGGYF